MNKKRELAMDILKQNACMINSCLSKDELKRFNGDYVGYLENCIKRLTGLEQSTQRKHPERGKEFENIVSQQSSSEMELE